LCIAVIALAAFLPGIVSLDQAWFEPHWVLLPAEAVVAFCVPLAPDSAQPLPLFSVLASRGPPSPRFA
jgi:hypothetical protein